MQPIILRYQTDEGEVHEQHYNCPTAFTELTPRQFVGAIATMRLAEKKPEAQWQLLPLLLKIPMKVLDQLSEVQRVQLLEQMEFLYDPEKLPYQWIVPKFSPGDFTTGVGMLNKLDTLHGPGDGLKHLTFGEFMHAEQRYEQVNSGLNSPKVNYKAIAMNELCGILYRKAHPQRKGFDDPRLPFQKAMIPIYAKALGRVNEQFKEATLLNYHGAKAQFPKLYKFIFPEALQNQPKDAEKLKKKTNQALTWLNMAIQMTERDVTKIAEIERSPLHLVLKVLDDTLAHNEELRKQHENMRHK